MQSYEPVLLVVGLVAALIVLPNAYWRFKAWRLKRDNFISESEFLQKNNLRRDEVLAAMKGLPQIRIRRVGKSDYIHPESAAIILKRFAALKLADTTRGLEQSSLSAAAGAAVGALAMASNAVTSYDKKGNDARNGRRSCGVAPNAELTMKSTQECPARWTGFNWQKLFSSGGGHCTSTVATFATFLKNLHLSGFVFILSSTKRQTNNIILSMLAAEHSKYGTTEATR